MVMEVVWTMLLLEPVTVCVRMRVAVRWPMPMVVHVCGSVGIGEFACMPVLVTMPVPVTVCVVLVWWLTGRKQWDA